MFFCYDIWYYCKYTADKDYYGYVYSDFCDEISPFINNNEELTDEEIELLEKLERWEYLNNINEQIIEYRNNKYK